MKGTDRHWALLVWLDEKGSLTLAEIIERFGVSKMTAHRDLDALEKRGVLKRIHGGAMSVNRGEAPAIIAAGTLPQRREHCLICQRPVGQHLLYSMSATSGEQQQFCCPHCGVSAQLAYPERMVMAMATDFLTGRPHPAQQSWFVLGSMVVPCCRPSMLTFEDEEMARRFQTGFGGRFGRLPAALDYLRGEMSLHQEGQGCPHCAAAHAQKS